MTKSFDFQRPSFRTSSPASLSQVFQRTVAAPSQHHPTNRFFQRRIAALLKLYCVRSRCQPDARRVGGGRGRASTPPTASFEAPVAEALVVETARVSSSCWRSSSAAAMRDHWKSKFLIKRVDRERCTFEYIFRSTRVPATNLTTVPLAPPRKKTVVKFVAGLTERYKKTYVFDDQPS